MNLIIQKNQSFKWMVTVVVAMIFCIFFCACEDDLSETHVMATSPKLTSSLAIGSTVILDKNNSSNQAMTLNWTPASNHGTNAGIAYSLQFDVNSDFSSPLSVEVGKSVNAKTYIMSELNTLMVTIMGIGAGETQQLHVRVKATVISEDIAPDFSNVFSFSAKTYDPTELLPPYKKLFIVGGATPRGWNIDSPDSLVRDVTDHFIFRFNEVFTADEFKIPTTTGNWGCDYYMPISSAGDITSTDVQLVPGGTPDYKWRIPTSGAYKITLDLRETKIHIKPFTPYDQLWLVGDATPAGWNIDNPTPMIADDEDPFLFIYEGPLSTGEFKIPTATGNWGADFFMPAVNHQPLSERAASFVVGGSPDKKWQVTEAGNYRITFNQLKETIQIVKI